MNIIPIYLVTKTETDTFSSKLNSIEKEILKINDFKGQSGKIILLPSVNGGIKKIIFGVGETIEPQIFGSLAKNLPEGEYEIKTQLKKEIAQNGYIFFLLGQYIFNAYKKAEPKKVKLVPPKAIDADFAKIIANAINMGRDLVNTPANDMGPNALAQKAQELAKEFGAEIEIIKGDDLLAQNYPLIHAVGRAATDAPQIVILRKPKKDVPKIGIVGKGVAFDTGGLNLKTGNFMTIMKKDMGGAACALSLFTILAQLDLNIDLNIYLPLVENAVSANSMRPGDIVTSRKGLSVEIDNTDAEGRLILADALTRASEDGMEAIFDFATLTGAARVALGPDLPPFYTNSENLAAQINEASKKVQDPLWRMPLWANYKEDLDSPIADMKNGGGAFAGSVTAALFLEKFVDAKEWVHFDVYCWNPSDKPARPKGGEIQAIRAVLEVLQKRYS